MTTKTRTVEAARTQEEIALLLDKGKDLKEDKHGLVYIGRENSWVYVLPLGRDLFGFIYKKRDVFLVLQHKNQYIYHINCFNSKYWAGLVILGRPCTTCGVLFPDSTINKLEQFATFTQVVV